MQMLMSWKASSTNDNVCKLHRHDKIIEVSLSPSVRRGTDELIITTPDRSVTIHIAFAQVDGLIAGVHEFNKSFSSKKGIRGCQCLSVITTNTHDGDAYFHFQFSGHSQRNCWLRFIHQKVTRLGNNKSWDGKYENDTKSSSLVIQYKARDDEHKEHSEIKDINDLLLSPQRLRKMASLFVGSYFRSPASPSIMKGVLKYLAPSKSKVNQKNDGFKSQIFMVLAKANAHCDRFTHLKWAKSRAHIHLETANSVAIKHIDLIEIYRSSLPGQRDDDCLFYLKITWNPRLEIEPLIVHHNLTNYAYQWTFVSALKSVCDAGGVSVKQWNTVLNPDKVSNGGIPASLGISGRPDDDSEEDIKPISVFCCTFNVAVSSPRDDPSSLSLWLKPKVSDFRADLFAITLQEVVDLSSPDLLLSRHCEFEWEDAIGKVLGDSVVKMESVVRGGLVLFLFARKRVIPELSQIAFGGVNVGAMGAPNKAGVAIRCEMRGRRLCFVGAHLPSGKGKNALRHDAFERISNEMKFDGDRLSSSSKRKKKRNRIRDHDAIFWCGDLNYRLWINNTQIGTVYDLIERKRADKLLKHDQLKRGQLRHEAFTDFEEAEISFLPTYKFEPGTSKYETRKHKPLRMPSYTDRILYHLNRKRVWMETMAYDAVTDVEISDHKPVYALFKVHAVTTKEMEEISMSSLNQNENEHEHELEPQIRTEAPLDLQRYFLQIEFLQKNYNFHFAESLKALSSASLQQQQQQDGNGVDRQKTFQNFEASHNDLMAQMTKLLGSMKSQFEEKSMQFLEADRMPQEEEEEAVPSSREPSFSTRNGQQNHVVVDDMLNLGVENDDNDEDLEEEDDDDIDDIASLMMTDDSFVGSEE